MSPTAFRAQIRRLLESGYHPVDAQDLATGEIAVPAGKTPVVLTFDDGSPNQFALRSDGTIDPSCSAGILATACARVSGADAKATFYVNKNPFGQQTASRQRRVLQALLGHGFQLGNHTLDHPDLATLPAGRVEQEFVRLQRLVLAAATKARLDTMALPFGVAPRPYRLAEKGSWQGDAYGFDIVLLVGANPSPSPYAAAFDQHGVPRIRGTSYLGGRTPLTGTYWLDLLEAHPHERYVSAGNPGHVTVPHRLAGQVAKRYRDRLITY
jgi:peptidoglycan/xylan/chitin deacetylase (PgdA/CDA1 family)